jgi:magnesium transporter
MQKCYELSSGKICATEAKNASIFVYVNPDESERKYLVEELSLDEHTLASSLDPEELGRLEFEPKHAAIIFKRPKRYSSEDNFLFKVSSQGFFLFKDKLFIITADDAGLFDGRQFRDVPSILDLFLRSLYRGVLHFEEHLRVMNQISDELEQQFNESTNNKSLMHMFTLEKGLVYYLNAISSNAKVLDRIKSHSPKLGISSEQIEYLDDLFIENNQCFEQANTYSKVLSSLMTARTSLISNNLNVTMKYLNAIVIAVAIPSFIAGVGGMSEFSMMTGSHRWFITYPLFLLAMIGVAVLTFFVIKKSEKYWK